jgi:hypothetical protein
MIFPEQTPLAIFCFTLQSDEDGMFRQKLWTYLPLI